MNDDKNRDLYSESVRSTQQAIKRMVNPDQPAVPYTETQASDIEQPAVVRHRRSDRHREETEGAQPVIPEVNAPETPVRPRPAPVIPQPNAAVPPRPAARAPQADADQQWTRQVPPRASDFNAQEKPARAQSAENGAPRGRTNVRPSQMTDTFARRPVTLDDEDYSENKKSVLPKIIWTVLILAVLCVAALALLPDGSVGPLSGIQSTVKTTANKAINGVKGLLGMATEEDAKVLEFKTSANTGTTGTSILFHMTTTQSIDAVRLQNESGAEIPAAAAVVNGEAEQNRIWSLTANFAQPYAGLVYAAYRTGNTWHASDLYVSMNVSLPAASPTPTPVATPVSTRVPTAIPAVAATGTVSPTTAPVTDAPTLAPTVYVTEAPTIEITLAPTVEITATPTPTPTPSPTPSPSPAPTASPVPRLAAEAAADASTSVIKITETVFSGGKTIASFQRENGYVAPNPDNYAQYEAGVLTFRGDNFRRNAAFGTANITQGSMNVIWKTELGSLRTKDSGTLYGVGFASQPAIIKWTKQVREWMNIYEAKKSVSALREVIFTAMDGKVYFLDLADGQATRDPISIGYPLRGSVSVDPLGRPMIAFGQSISMLPSKTGDIGYYLYSLLDSKELMFINGRQSSSQKQYTTNGSFDGTALFIRRSDNTALIVAGENGLLYTAELNPTFTYPDEENPDAKVSLSINKSINYLRSKMNAEKDANVSIESSVAMYDKYVYMADRYGFLRCVDTDTLKTVWAFDNGDNTDAAVALDFDSDTAVSLYTGNTAYARLGSKKEVSIRRLNALTGEQIWEYNIKCAYDKTELSGCKASPVIGEKSIDNLVIFTVNMTDTGSSIIALNKASGSVAWRFDMTANAISSPVAVYNDAGAAWIIQGDQDGVLHMLNGETGREISTLDLGGDIQASPAVFRDTLVIGTCSKDNAFMYGIQLK